MATISLLSPSAARAQLPPPFATSSTPLHLIAQGAESLLFKTTFLSPETAAALKVRPVKRWRHAALDRRLTRQRILAEARVLVKARRTGVPVPAVLGLDWVEGWLVTEWLDGGTVKEAIRSYDRCVLDVAAAETRTAVGTEQARKVDVDHEAFRTLLKDMGRVVGQIHSAGIIHGDLTTSNLMFRRPARAGDSSPEETQNDGRLWSGTMVVIDFGLATSSVSEEDRAVDLYVLERAFGSTHPRQEADFGIVLDAYAAATGKAGRVVLRKLEDVRMRGRKKSMLG